jgi:uncharacterized protein DUF3455
MIKSSKLAIFLLAVFAAVSAAAEPAASSAGLAQKLKVGADESLAMIVPAKGVQIYECRAAKGEGGHEWAFVAPEADLFDMRGMRIGHHYAGPSWEASDGSKIVGSVKARADAPADGAIAWLLLGAKSVGPDGAFSHVSSVRRVNTVGGSAPGTGCAASAAGALARVPYTADYFFFTRD